MLSKDIINIIIRYTYSKCHDCQKIHNHTKLFFDIFLTGETLCKYCGLDFCDLCRYKFNRFDNREIGCYIQNYGLYCPDCFDKIKKCEQCFDINAINDECIMCGLKCCDDCKDILHNICRTCIYYLDIDNN